MLLLWRHSEYTIVLHHTKNVVEKCLECKSKRYKEEKIDKAHISRKHSERTMCCKDMRMMPNQWQSSIPNIGGELFFCPYPDCQRYYREPTNVYCCLSMIHRINDG